MGKMNFNNEQIKQIIDTIVIVVDSREQKNQHITSMFDKYGINWERRKLNSGDYSAYVPINEELGIFEEINLEDELCVERKKNCDEIIQNLTKHRDRFYREFERSGAKIPILIEDSFKNAVKGYYRSDIPPKTFLGALFSFVDHNDTFFYFIGDDSLSALWIYDILKYRIRSKLKNL